MGMDYGKINKWILREDSFDAVHLGKTEAVMSLGNGYLGLRSAAEERYLNEARDLLINGTFNKCDPTAVTELPNAADMTAIELWINGERFTLEQGQVKFYSKELNIRTAELTRKVIWISPKGDHLSLVFRRVVSLTRLHQFAIRVEITPLLGNADLKIKSGIDGRVTNTGAQHFTDGDKRFYENRYIQYVPKTTESGITFVLNTAHSFAKRTGASISAGSEEGASCCACKEEIPLEVPTQIYMELRRAYGGYEVKAEQGETLVIEKHCNVYTTRDFDTQDMTVPELQKYSLDELKKQLSAGYGRLAEETAAAWKEQVWDRVPITIEGVPFWCSAKAEDASQAEGTGQSEDISQAEDAACSAAAFDQFAIRFSQYHLRLMLPAHDNRLNIGAKGLSGEGYRGHCFWDTEIFLLPYYAFTQPEAARKLEEYRYFSLPGAHAKAAHNGYQGAMFPWESAWLDDGEVTPEYQDVDIITGLPIKVWSGFIEQHITADVAFGVWQYYTITGDQDYMDRYGYELIFDTARFWVSRLEDKCRQIHESVNPDTGVTEFSETVTDDGLYHICDVVGPDEYKEHKTDNAFTNYLAVWNIRKAMEYYELLRTEKPDLFDALNQKLDLDAYYRQWTSKVDRVFLPVPNECGVLPQDSTYLTLKDIDLSKYKSQDFVNGLFRDFNLTQINQIQVSKQADVLVLFFLLEDLFPHEVKAATWEYYAARTLHDSSLSLCTHAVLAADMRQMDLAYDFFEKSAQIDLGPVMTTSDAGIHTASFGGIWQGVVYGFGGLRMLGGKLRIDPVLPKEWGRLVYTLIWQGQKLQVEVTRTGSGDSDKEKIGSGQGTAGQSARDGVTVAGANQKVVVTNLTATAPIELELCGETKVLENVLTTG
ncbi:MAG: glycoside hydrolase family 65 protein [Lachnospiraceae bacterium]|nr:glycoside hydrolase family 65 protein [Lachnospiraceae bacterium]